MKSCQLGGELVGLAARVVGFALGGNGIHVLVAEPGIKESALAMHFGGTHICVPVSHRSESGPGVKVDASQAVGWGDQCAGTLSIRSEGLPILIEFSVKATRTPTCQDFFERYNIDAQQIGKGFRVGSERHDRPNVEVAIRPTIQPMSYARCEGVVYRRVAKSTLNAHGR